MTAAIDAVVDLPIDALTHPELLTALGALETALWRVPRSRASDPGPPGRRSLPRRTRRHLDAAVISERLRISRDEAHRRLKDARHLGPRRTLSGEPLAPKLTHTAAAQAQGLIGPEHVRIIRTFFDDLPDAVDFPAREHADATLARIAAEQLPDGLRTAAARLLALLHPDGDFTDVDRARRRGITVGPQGPDGHEQASTACSTPKAAPPSTR